jgi:CheY-like chemotaxis protein
MTMTTILVVDDVYTVRVKLHLVLRKAGGFAVHIAASGAEALQMVAGHAPDALVLDFVMADMDGPATLHALRASGMTCPVVLYTARPEQYPGEFAALGFDAAVSKADSIGTLIAVIRRVLRGRADAHHPARPACGSSHQYLSEQPV